MPIPRTLQIKCATWTQVEAFYGRKLRRGGLLSMKVPFQTEPGAVVTVGVELPSRIVLTVDGIVSRASMAEGDPRTWIEIDLAEGGDELAARLEELAREAQREALAPVALDLAPPAGAAAAATAPDEAVVALVAPSPSGPVPTSVAVVVSSPVPLEVDGPSRPPAPAAGWEGPAEATIAGVRAPTQPAVAAPPSLPRTATSPGVGGVRVSIAAAPAAPRTATGVGGAPAEPGAAPRTTTAPRPAPSDEGLSGDERTLFQRFAAELRRLRLLPVHEVLGVGPDAGAEEIRAAWMAHLRRFHPDVVARRRVPVLEHLAEELTILGNRAYDRLRAALVAEGRGASFGSSLVAPRGWLIGFDELSTGDASRLGSTRIPVLLDGSSTAQAARPPASVAAADGADLEREARAHLGAGNSLAAREVLAGALCVYPRSRPLRSLYYVASALIALDAGQLVLAVAQLETAIAHHEACVEAAQLLEQVRQHGGVDRASLWGVFQ